MIRIDDRNQTQSKKDRFGLKILDLIVKKYHGDRKISDVTAYIERYEYLKNREN